MAAPAIGIDFGTTNSSVAVLLIGKLEVIANVKNNRTTPSCVAFTDKNRLVGEAAKDQANENLTNTIFNVQRLIGRKFDDPAIQRDMKHWPFTVRDVDTEPVIEVQDRFATSKSSAEQISAMILCEMKKTAEKCLGQTVTNAVITVPNMFNRIQRQTIMNAAKKAELKVLRIISATSASAIAYGFDKKNAIDHDALIFDLGK